MCELKPNPNSMIYSHLSNSILCTLPLKTKLYRKSDLQRHYKREVDKDKDVKGIKSQILREILGIDLLAKTKRKNISFYKEPSYAQ